MKRTRSPRPDRRAFHTAGGTWWSRLRSFALILLSLLAISSGLLGYRIGLSETQRLGQVDTDLGLYRVNVYSIRPDFVPRTAPGTLSLIGRVLGPEGLHATEAWASLSPEGGEALRGEGGAFSFLDLIPGRYTLSAGMPGRADARITLILQTSPDVKEQTLTLNETGVYTLLSPLDSSYARLDLRLYEEGEALALNDGLPIAGFDRLNLFGRVLGGDGQPEPEALTSLVPDGSQAAAGTAGAAFSYLDLEQGSYTLSAQLPEGEALSLRLTILKTETQGEGAKLAVDDTGAYTLSAAPAVSYARLDLRADQGQLLLSLSEERDIPLKAYQFWQRETEAYIFNQRSGEHSAANAGDRGLIAPGSSGSFIFAVENPGVFPTQYAISLSEVYSGPHRLPLRYRVKEDVLRAGDQGWGRWQAAEDVSVPVLVIQPGELRYYTLQWMWDSADDKLDTAIGSAADNIRYKLHVNVTQINPEFSGQTI